MPQYDSIIIGAGHNGLVCAAYLARAGQRVLVLEAAESPGGLAATREFHPGFRVAAAHTAMHFSDKVTTDLGLELATINPRLVGLDTNGKHVVADGDALTGGAEDDAAAYGDYRALMCHFADALAPFWQKTMPRIGTSSIRELLTFAHMGLNLRRLGRKDMQEFMRVASLPARDLMDENFENELVKATLSWDGLIGSRMAPRSPNSAVLAMLYRMSGAPCDVASMIASLTAAAESAGAEIRCNAAVNRITIDGDENGLSTSGVELRDGERIDADRVISATDPQRTFVNLVGVEYLDIGFTNRIRRLRCNGLVGKLHLALDGAPEFSNLDSPHGRLIIAPDMDAIEFAFDDAKYGASSEAPVMEACVPSLQDPTLAPDGKHVLSAHVMFVPYELKGGWTDTARESVRERAIDTIAEYAPGIRQQIVGSEFLTPADIEREYRVTGGHWHHTEFAMDQMLMMRPTYGAAQYATSIPGLWLCGAGCHPGGDLTGAAGHNAAHEILR